MVMEARGGASTTANCERARATILASHKCCLEWVLHICIRQCENAPTLALALLALALALALGLALGVLAT
jgi:hypothetical protein